MWGGGGGGGAEAFFTEFNYSVGKQMLIRECAYLALDEVTTLWPAIHVVNYNKLPLPPNNRATRYIM